MIGSVPAMAQPPRSWGELAPTMTRVRLCVVAALIGLAYWEPIRHSLVTRWLNDGNWSHGWLVPVFSLYFVSMRREELSRAVVKPSYVGAVILVLALALRFVSAWWWAMAYPQALSLIGTLLGVTLLLGGWQIIRITWFPIVFLVFAVPLPGWLFVELTQPLRAFASAAAAAIMPFFATDLWTEAQAVVIDYSTPGGKQGRLNVEEACSGMRLMMSFVTLGVAMAYLGYRPIWQRVLMVAACVPTAVACNTVRVTTTGLLFIHGYDDLAKGSPHQMLGLVMLVLALGMYALLAYVLSHLFVEDTRETASDQATA